VLLDAFLRGVFAFVGLFTLLAARSWWDAWCTRAGVPSENMDEILQACAATLPVGFVAIVEGVARRWEPSWRRALGAGAVAFAVAFAAGQLAPFVAAFLDAMIEKGATSFGALAAMGNAGFAFASSTRAEATVALGWNAGFALLALVRLRGTRLLIQSLLVVAPMAVAVLRARAADHHPVELYFNRLLGEAVACGVVLPLAAEAARRTGDRAFARLTLEEPGEAPASRADAYRGLPGLLAYVATAALLLAVPGLDRWRRERALPPSPTPEELAFRHRWYGIDAGMLPGSGAPALAKESAFARLRVRPRAGALDAISVEVEAGLTGFQGDRSELRLASVLRVDGRDGAAPVTSEWVRDEAQGLHRLERFVLAGLAPGRHSIAALTSMALSFPVGAPPCWSETLASEERVEVVPGSLRSEIALATPFSFDPEWFLYESRNGSSATPIRFVTEQAPLAVRSRVELYEGSRLLAVTHLSLEAGRGGWISLEPESGRLVRGWHTIRLVVSPDPDFALASSPTVGEILGASFERTFQVAQR
jgi:hypothetical protein